MDPLTLSATAKSWLLNISSNASLSAYECPQAAMPAVPSRHNPFELCGEMRRGSAKSIRARA